MICLQCLKLSRDCQHGLQPPPQLTERHVDILRLLGQGLRNKEIGAQLFLTEGTVKVYFSREIFPRIGVKSRLEAALWAWKHAELLEQITSGQPA